MKEEILKMRPIGNRIILKQDRIKKAGSIILMAEAAEKSKFCEVIAIGPDVNDIHKGDKVISDPYAGYVLYEDEEVIYTVQEDANVLAVIDN